MSVIETMPGTTIHPRTLLHQLLEDVEAGTVKGVLVVAVNTDDVMCVAWSNMPVPHLAMAAMAVDAKVREKVLPRIEP